MQRRSNEPILWVLFSAGGVFAAVSIPVLLFLTCLAFPLGWIESPSYQGMHDLVSSHIVRLGLFALCFFSLFHWAHRFRYTLYDGLQIKHLNQLIFPFCYGGALLGSAIAGYLLWTFNGR
jgi:fumarate reductase subunit D